MDRSTKLLCALAIGLLLWSSVCSAQHYEFKDGYPTPETARRVQDDQDYQRAIQAYRFFYPTVSMEARSRGRVTPAWRTTRGR